MIYIPVIRSQYPQDHSAWWFCFFLGVFGSFFGEIGTATGLGSAVAEVRHILSRCSWGVVRPNQESCPFLVEQIMWVTQIPKLVSSVFARFFSTLQQGHQREPGLYIGKENLFWGMAQFYWNSCLLSMTMVPLRPIWPEKRGRCMEVDMQAMDSGHNFRQFWTCIRLGLWHRVIKENGELV